VVMAVNVVVALYYYLVWTAKLFQPAPQPAAAAPEAAVPEAAAPHPEAAPPGASGAGRPGALLPLPVPLAVCLGLAAAVGVLLSIAPQLVLQVTSVTLFG
jgi:NADH-quinone oxidoreductase subunit N